MKREIEVRIKNLGPVKEADIRIGDVTLFLGYPNVGKSYVLKAIYLTHALLDPSVHEIIATELKNAVRRKTEEVVERLLSFALLLCAVDEGKREKIERKLKELGFRVAVESSEVELERREVVDVKLVAESALSKLYKKNLPVYNPDFVASSIAIPDTWMLLGREVRKVEEKIASSYSGILLRYSSSEI